MFYPWYKKQNQLFILRIICNETLLNTEVEIDA